MSKQDYYELLEVERGASDEELKKAYRRLAMRYHPDRNSGDADAEQKFKDINEAYEVLRDEQKRAAYDRYGHAAFESGGGGNGFGGFSGFGGGGFADIFDQMFGDVMGGSRRGGSANTRGADLRYNMEITLEEAFRGDSVTIHVPTSVTCETCHGSGAAEGSQPVTCGTCQGMGKVRMQQGFFTIERTCPTCQGQGKIIKNPCKKCSGSGRVHKEKVLSVTIPAGIEDGMRIRLAEKGEAGVRGGATGDLYIFVSIKPHKVFERHGADIYCQIPIAMTTASLGGVIDVPTINGEREVLTIPAGTQTGQQLRLRNKGMNVMRSSSRGDMIAQIVVETPVKLNKRQEELLREFEKEGGGQETHSPQSSGFFSRIKEFFEDLKD